MHIALYIPCNGVARMPQIEFDDCFNRLFDCSIRVYRSLLIFINQPRVAKIWEGLEPPRPSLDHCRDLFPVGLHVKIEKICASY